MVRALAAISDARVQGDALGSMEISFEPRILRGGHYRFDVGAVTGSAGSVSLLFQALLLPLAHAEATSRLTLVGGTHVPWSPTVDYLIGVFLPVLREIGVDITVSLRRRGWYPAGGGEIEAAMTPARGLRALRWETPAGPPCLAGISTVSRLPVTIAERQRRRALARLEERCLQADIAVAGDDDALGPGTSLLLTAAGPGRLAGFCALGRRGLRAEAVADAAVDPLFAYLDSGAAVDDHLADQLLPFLALAQHPSVLTCPSISEHLRTVAWVVEQLLPTRVSLDEGPPARVTVSPGAGGPGVPAMLDRRES
ncbi:MAG: RNA 3'-phosphate cyclase [Candidatus Rokubacteria bacterium]|nr:RNA 3'-phosphate cyclase [Candidatus Rokubacteria bacterium]